MKVLAIGDPHFRVDNVQEVNLFIEKIEALVKIQSPDLIVVLGDVLHTHERLHTVPLNLAINFIKILSSYSPVICLVGNHDMCNNQQFLTSNHWMNCLKDIPNVEVADKVIYKTLNKINFLFVPYVPNGKFQEALLTCKEDYKKMNCIFAHQEFQGCKMGAITSVDGDIWPENFPCIISGHIHSKQNPQKNIYYCGSSMQVAFGESEKNIIPILTFKDPSSKYSLEEVDLELPRKKIIYSSIDEVEDLKLAGKKGDQVKLSLEGSYDEFKALKKTKKYKDIIKTGVKVVFKPKKIIPKENLDKEDIDNPPEETDFAKILSTLVLKEKNSFLCQIYESIFNNKEIPEDYYLFL